MFID